ncbi:sugar-binding transcriptional regulator [Arhodomonas sp. AD133]|uniref:sugar-binding transcriptional regulator n=1 Tax=Arhodomonas sp. AD133 TaxID=3415009 RepID=UPI003EBE7E7A
MATPKDSKRYETERRIYRTLQMHYLEGMKQSEIARVTGDSVATVSRLIKQGHELGMVEINIRSPFAPTLDLERELMAAAGLDEVLVVPAVSDNEAIVLQSVGEAAANLLMSRIGNGATICITGGKGVTATVEGMAGGHDFDVEVVPTTGLVQGKHYTDVNHVASEMARKLGGRAYQIHAPMFADTAQQRDVLLEMRSVRDVFDRARRASVAVVGIGSIESDQSSYFDLHPDGIADRDRILEMGAKAELIAHLLDGDGALCDYSMNAHLVALRPDELHDIPCTIGVASGAAKVEPIRSVLRGGHLRALVTDERTARAVLDLLRSC